MQRGFVPILFVLIVGLASAGVVGTFYLKKNYFTPFETKSTVSTSQSPLPTSSIDETVYTEQSRSANWKTFTSSEYSFTMKHPETWVVSFDKDVSNGINKYTFSAPSGDKKDKEYFDSAIFVTVWSKSPKLGKSIEEYFKELQLEAPQSIPAPPGSAKIENLTIDGFSAVKQLSMAPIEPAVSMNVYVLKQPYLFDIFLWHSYTYTLDKQQLALFDEILTTFKFLDSKSNSE